MGAPFQREPCRNHPVNRGFLGPPRKAHTRRHDADAGRGQGRCGPSLQHRWRCADRVPRRGGRALPGRAVRPMVRAAARPGDPAQHRRLPRGRPPLRDHASDGRDRGRGHRRQRNARAHAAAPGREHRAPRHRWTAGGQRSLPRRPRPGRPRPGGTRAAEGARPRLGRPGAVSGDRRSRLHRRGDAAAGRGGPDDGPRRPPVPADVRGRAPRRRHGAGHRAPAPHRRGPGGGDRQPGCAGGSTRYRTAPCATPVFLWSSRR
jgi:hypothetical protein